MSKHKSSARVCHKNMQPEVVHVGALKIISKKYCVTSQTAYHIAELARHKNVTEGRIIDKLMREYRLTSMRSKLPTPGRRL